MAIFGFVSQKEVDRLARELEALKAAQPRYERWLLETADAEQFNLPDPSVYGNQADLYRKLSWVMLAVDLVASAGALSKFNVSRIKANEEAQDIPSHDFEQLLSHPNDIDSRYEFLYATIAFMKLTGNCYWWLNCADEYSPPDELWILPTQMVIPVPDEQMYLKGYMYYPGNGREIFLEPHQIVHFKRFNPFSRFLGLSAIESIALVAQGDIGMQEWNTRLFKENNARLPGVMTFEQMIADPTWEKIKDDTREAAKKRELLMLRGVGEGGVKWMQNAVSQREMEFLAGRNHNRDEIMTILAPGSYTMLSENNTQANSVVGRASFYELAVYPMQIMIAEKITNSILPRYGGRKLVGEFEDIRMADKDLKLREQEAFERVHTVEEVRKEMYGDEPLGDERDKLLPAQVTAKAEEKPEEPAVDEVNNTQMDKSFEQEPPETQPNDAEANKAMRDDLDRWKRKAMKKIGTAVPFDSDNIPQYVMEQIGAGLGACKTEADVKRLFTNVDESRIHLTVAAIRQALNFKAR